MYWSHSWGSQGRCQFATRAAAATQRGAPLLGTLLHLHCTALVHSPAPHPPPLSRDPQHCGCGQERRCHGRQQPAQAHAGARRGELLCLSWRFVRIGCADCAATCSSPCAWRGKGGESSWAVPSPCRPAMHALRRTAAADLGGACVLTFGLPNCPCVCSCAASAPPPWMSTGSTLRKTRPWSGEHGVC